MPIGNNLSPAPTLALMQATQADLRALPRSDQKIDPDIEAAARDFEAMFIAEMVKPMIESVPVDDMFGGGKGEDVFRGLLTQEYGKKMAAAGGIGLASHVRDAMIKLQNAQ